MRFSEALIPTLKELPKDAEIPSHRLMLRAGLVRQLTAGVYSYLPLGYRALLKVIAIVREEMDAAGGQEILMPVIHPIEIWDESLRPDSSLSRYGTSQAATWISATRCSA